MDALAWAGRARGGVVVVEGLGESLVGAGGDFFCCHRPVGFARVIDGLADLGFGLFLLAQAFGGGGDDVASLDADLLQLGELSPMALKSNPSFADRIFNQWLALPETNRLVRASRLL